MGKYNISILILLCGFFSSLMDVLLVLENMHKGLKPDFTVLLLWLLREQPILNVTAYWLLSIKKILTLDTAFALINKGNVHAPRSN